MSDYQLWLGDCLEEMDRIEDGSIDAIICDLPFQITACKWDKMIPFEPLWKHYKRVIKRNGAIVLFGSQPFTSLLVMSNLEWFKYEWIWDKVKPSNHLNSHRMPMQRHNSILVFCERATVFNRQFGRKNQKEFRPNRKNLIASDRHGSTYGNHKYKYSEDYNHELITPMSILSMSIREVKASLHPNQKPVALLEYLIKTYTNEGETVLDNTCGSGSTLEAAMRCNRRSIGIEKHKPYFEVAKSRLEKIAAELRGELTHLPMFAEAAA